jgi:hypothetical protein
MGSAAKYRHKEANICWWTWRYACGKVWLMKEPQGDNNWSSTGNPCLAGAGAWRSCVYGLDFWFKYSIISRYSCWLGTFLHFLCPISQLLAPLLFCYVIFERDRYLTMAFSLLVWSVSIHLVLFHFVPSHFVPVISSSDTSRPRAGRFAPCHFVRW